LSSLFSWATSYSRIYSSAYSRHHMRHVLLVLGCMETHFLNDVPAAEYTTLHVHDMETPTYHRVSRPAFTVSHVHPMLRASYLQSIVASESESGGAPRTTTVVS
jgi:hypothetical protein